MRSVTPSLLHVNGAGNLKATATLPAEYLTYSCRLLTRRLSITAIEYSLSYKAFLVPIFDWGHPQCRKAVTSNGPLILSMGVARS